MRARGFEGRLSELPELLRRAREGAFASLPPGARYEIRQAFSASESVDELTAVAWMAEGDWQQKADWPMIPQGHRQVDVLSGVWIWERGIVPSSANIP